MKTIIIIASGPSLTRSDVERVEGAGIHIMGINNAYQITDKLKYHYACDTKWWRWAYSNGKGAPPFPPQEHTEKYSLNDEGRPKTRGKDDGWPGVYQMKMGNRQGLSKEWPILCWGGNSGYQAINLAYLLGYERILLLGYDMKERNGNSHWHRDHNFQGSTNPCAGTFSGWLRDFKTLAEAIRHTGVKVINCTRDTALHCFPEMKLEEAL